MSTADTLAKAAVIGAVGLIAVLVLVGGPLMWWSPRQLSLIHI